LRFFEELCAIPHGSGNPGAVCRYCEAFAAARGLSYHRDGADNVIIIKPASPGYEDAEPLILQGHLDMVCVKDPACGIDMEKDGLDLAVDGDWIFAKGTTLGGDDGIAVAMALAALDAKDLRHPRLEAVFTTDEEVGMLGAAALDVSPLRGRRLLNLDVGEGLLTVGGAFRLRHG
jgi:dipeptidase D